MKAVCIKSYYDKCLHRSMTPGDELEVTEERFAELSGRKVVKKKEVFAVEYTQERAVGFLTLHSVIVMILMIRRTESSEMGQRFLLLSCITSPPDGYKYKRVHYRVSAQNNPNFYADQVDTLKASGMDGYAGDKYRFIDKFQAWIE